MEKIVKLTSTKEVEVNGIMKRINRLNGVAGFSF